MAKRRNILRVLKGKPTLEGAGVRLHRVFGYSQVPTFDPFLLLDDFRSDKRQDYIAGFPWHPHRGIETITYVIAGDVEHGDSMGNKGVISAGDVSVDDRGQRHHPPGNAQGRHGGPDVRLPALGQPAQSHKMMDPRYRDVRSEQVPEVKLGSGATVKVICGAVAGRQGPVRDIVTDPEYLDVSVPAGAEFAHRVPRGHTVFAYVIEGKGLFCDEENPFAYDVEGVNYFDMQRDPWIDERNARPLRRRRRGQGVRREGRRPLSPHLGKADRRARGLVRPDRHEHERGA